MPLVRARGFTLLELVVALALLTVVTGGLWRALDASRQAYFAQMQRVELLRTLRASAIILPAELRELDPRDSDITAMSPTSITMRATRQLAFVCDPPRVSEDGTVALTVRRRPFFGARRSFSVGDSALLFFEGDPATWGDDAWVRGEVVSAVGEDCPDADQPRPGYRLTLRLAQVAGSPADTRGVTRGAPVRGFATVAYTLYRSPSDTEWYLGQQAQNATPQPLIGPLTGPTGVAFAYFDSAGASTTSVARVAEIEVRVRGRTALPIPVSQSRSVYEIDSLVTRVSLRNRPRGSGSP